MTIVLSYKVCSDFDTTIELIQLWIFVLLPILKYIVLNYHLSWLLSFFGTLFNFVLE